MEEYIDLFKREGYSKNADVENLKGLTEFDLITMGITKRGMCKYTWSFIVKCFVLSAHLQRLVKALHFLVYPNKSMVCARALHILYASLALIDCCFF